MYACITLIFWSSQLLYIIKLKDASYVSQSIVEKLLPLLNQHLLSESILHHWLGLFDLIHLHLEEFLGCMIKSQESRQI